MVVRHMQEADVPAVAALEKVIFSDAWSEASVARTLAARVTLAYVAEQEGRLAGYFLGMQLFEEAEVYRVAVDPAFRKQGIGRRLMEAFLAESAKQGATDWSLEVRTQNVAAIALYEGLGYRTESTRKRYYHDPEDDAAIMWRRTGSNSPLAE